MVSATVTLYRDIGLSPSYMRTIDFTSKIAQTTWFNSIPSSQRTTLTNVNYNKLQNSFAIHEPIGDVYDYTYCRIQDLDESGRTYYGFVSGVVLVDEETTRFDILIDPIQTFMCEWSIGESFVVREHIDRWDSGDNPINVKPSEVKMSTFSKVESMRSISNPYSNLRVVIIAFSSDDYVTLAEKTNIDRIFYGYAIIDIDDFDRNVPTIRIGREYFRLSNESNIYSDIVYFPSYSQICDGTVFSDLGINPASIVSISVLPYGYIQEINLGSGTTSLGVTLPSFNYCYTPTEAPSGQEIVFTAPEQQASILISNPAETTLYFFNNMLTYSIARTANTYSDNLGLQNLAPCDQNVDEDTRAYDTCISIGLLQYSEVANYSGRTISINVDQPVKPSNGDLASDTFEPCMYMEPFRKYVWMDYKGNNFGEIPDFLIASGADGEGLNIYLKNLYDVSGASIQLLANKGYDSFTLAQAGSEGNNAIFRCDNIAFVNDTWLNYKLTSLDSDRSNAKLQAVATVITGGIYGAYGGALVGSRSASGDWDDANTRNTLLKRGASGAAIVGGLASVGAGVVNAYVGLQAQKNKENSVKNQASNIVSESDVISYIKHNFWLSLITMKCDDVNYNMGYSTLKYYGQDISTFKTPNIRSRKYYNYIITQGCSIDGALNADIKNQLASIFDSGITIFHADYCDEPDYPTDSDGNEYENIERALL